MTRIMSAVNAVHASCLYKQLQTPFAADSIAIIHVITTLMEVPFPYDPLLGCQSVSTLSIINPFFTNFPGSLRATPVPPLSTNQVDTIQVNNPPNLCCTSEFCSVLFSVPSCITAFNKPMQAAGNCECPHSRSSLAASHIPSMWSFNTFHSPLQPNSQVFSAYKSFCSIVELFLMDTLSSSPRVYEKSKESVGLHILHTHAPSGNRATVRRATMFHRSSTTKLRCATNKHKIRFCKLDHVTLSQLVFLLPYGLRFSGALEPHRSSCSLS
jgi:hypothetical protein